MESIYIIGAISAVTLLILFTIKKRQKKANSNPVRKNNNTGKCHNINSRFYKKLTDYTEYDTMQECIDSGGEKSRNPTNLM